MVLLREMLESDDSQAGQEAKQKGLTHVGWGRYADKSGKVVAKSVDGKLVTVDADNSAPTRPSRRQDREPIIPLKRVDDPYGDPPKKPVTPSNYMGSSPNSGIAGDPNSKWIRKEPRSSPAAVPSNKQTTPQADVGKALVDKALQKYGGRWDAVYNAVVDKQAQLETDPAFGMAGHGSKEYWAARGQMQRLQSMRDYMDRTKQQRTKDKPDDFLTHQHSDEF